ncbi:MAG TPA: ThuA domain-containing protein [Pyrinomonadaceae bacterium]|nr:ThuA domain-containing protein [Pyrinomonadaceae bacterium]
MINHFSRLRFLFCIAFIFGLISPVLASNPKKLLVVTVTKGFVHMSIPVAEKVIEELGKKNNNFTVDFARTDDDLAAKMNPKTLQNYDGIIFASTTGDLPLPSMEAFLNWIKAGHAFIGIHAATDTFKENESYIEMIGGVFLAHGPQLKVTLNVNDQKHAATKHFDKNFEIFDEIYTFKNFQRDKLRVLLSLDKNPNQNDKENFDKPGFYPIAWCRKYGKGRVFYTALGHREDVLESEFFKTHLLGGILWTLKQAKGSDKPQVENKK